jgi:hypothetical protein
MSREGRNSVYRRRLKNIAVLTCVLAFTVVSLVFCVYSLGKQETLDGLGFSRRVVWPLCAGIALFAVLLTYLGRTKRLWLSGDKTAVQLMGPRKTQLVVIASVASFFLLRAVGVRYPTVKMWVLISGLTFLALGLSFELCVSVLRVKGVLPVPDHVRREGP